MDQYNVQWLPIQLFDPDQEIADVFVSWRSYRGIVLGRKSTARYLWLHLKVDTKRLLNEHVLENLDGVMFVSERERDRVSEEERNILSQNDVKLIVTRNGLDGSYFSEGDVTRTEPRFVYASQPNYGLEWLLDSWPLIKSQVPNAVLDVYGDYPGEYEVINGASSDPYEKMREKARVIEKMNRLDGVTRHGMVDQHTLSKAFARASYWLYPTSTPETSCITAMRAQALGAIPITSRYANSALPETCGRFDMGPVGLEHHEWSTSLDNSDSSSSLDNSDDQIRARKLFASAVVSAVHKHPETIREHRVKMQEWARREFSWRRVAKQWAKEFSSFLSTKKTSLSLSSSFGDDSRKKMIFTFIWTTPPPTFTLRFRRAIESALFHHPDATVYVYSNSLQDEMFESWRSKYGYDIHVKPYDIKTMIRESVVSKNKDLISRFFETLSLQPIRFPNVEADLIRLLALLSHGGVYLDLDAIVLRPLHGLSNVAAWEGDVPDPVLSASQCAQESGTTCTIGNAVLIFDSGNFFLESCLIRWLRKYTDTAGRLNWEYAGAVLTDTFWENRFEESTLRVLSRKSFYFYGQFGWGRFFNRQPDEHRQYARLLRESYVAHFWNHVHTHHLPQRGSLMFHVLNDFRLQLGNPESGLGVEGDLVEYI